MYSNTLSIILLLLWLGIVGFSLFKAGQLEERRRQLRLRREKEEKQLEALRESLRQKLSRIINSWLV